jgi:hypothetical protein
MGAALMQLELHGWGTHVVSGAAGRTPGRRERVARVTAGCREHRGTRMRLARVASFMFASSESLRDHEMVSAGVIEAWVVSHVGSAGGRLALGRR